MKYSPRSKRLSGINVYMTNTPTDCPDGTGT